MQFIIFTCRKIAFQMPLTAFRTGVIPKNIKAISFIYRKKPAARHNSVYDKRMMRSEHPLIWNPDGSEMKNAIDKVEALDLSLFNRIDSETSTADRRSLLAVQRATTRRHECYAYLEIGSHLGGSIQPHLADTRCNRIYSIDPRPLQQADDRSELRVCNYERNSTERMLELLKVIAPNEVSKIQCFDMDASEVDLSQIKERPQLALIDGEHTKNAALSDFRFCKNVISNDGTIVFHDFGIIFPAIREICKFLDKKHQKYIPLKLEGSVFAIFFDTDTIRSDPYLMSLYILHKNLLRYYPLIHRFKGMLPISIWVRLKYYYNLWIRSRINT